MCWSAAGTPDGTHHATSYTLADDCLGTVATLIGQSFSQCTAITGRAEWFSVGGMVSGDKNRKTVSNDRCQQWLKIVEGASGDCKRYEGVTRQQMGGMGRFSLGSESLQPKYTAGGAVTGFKGGESLGENVIWITSCRGQRQF